MNIKTTVKSVKYPKLREFGLDRRYKLTEKQIANIRKRRKQGQTYSAIAKKFNISQNTVRYYVNDEYRQKIMAINAKRKNTKATEYTRYARKVLYKEHRKYLTFIKWKKDNIKRNTLELKKIIA